MKKMKKKIDPAILSFSRDIISVVLQGNSDLKKAENWDDLTAFTKICNI